MLKIAWVEMLSWSPYHFTWEAQYFVFRVWSWVSYLSYLTSSSRKITLEQQPANTSKIAIAGCMVLKGPKRIQLSLCFRGWKTELNLRTRKRVLVPRFLQTRSSSGIPFTKKKNNDVIFFGGASYCNSLNNSFLPLSVF